MESGKVVAGKYRLNQLLGSGGMAQVWSATNTFTDRQVAIKFMHAEVAKTPESAKRFLKEAKVSARVNHPNVIDVFDVGQTEEGQLFLVMELLTGFSLEVGLRRQNPRMTAYELGLVMVEVAQALAAAHKTGIVHRDLKPSNVFLHKIRDGIVMPKVVDFGVSKFLEEDQNNALTIAGTVLGSPLYMSPEQARGDGPIDGRTDIFAFGAILFEAFCGFRPYDAKNFNGLIVKIATTKPKNIDECAPDVPESMRRVIRACLESDLKKRAKSFDEVLPMLRAALDELENSPLRLPSPTTASSIDPEETNALPVVRASERPPPSSDHIRVAGAIPLSPTSGGSASIPPGAVSLPPFPASGATGPSWHTPNTSYASTQPIAEPNKSKTRMVAIVVGVGALSAIVGLSVALGRGGKSAPRAAAVVSPETLAKSTEAVGAVQGTVSGTANAHGSPGAEPAAVSVDSLPLARATNGAIPEGSGRLVVEGAPNACALSIDGKAHGATPVSADVAAGTHRLRCQWTNGKARASTVTLKSGATESVRFTPDR